MLGKRPYKHSVIMGMQNTLHFISEIKLHRCLWDPTHEEYKNKVARDNAWEALSICMGHNADDLVAKWQSLRSTLRRYKSGIRRRAQESGDADKLQVVTWPYYSAMSFVSSTEDDDLRVISLPAKMVPEKPKLPSSATRPQPKPKPIQHSSASQEAPPKIPTKKPTSSPDLVKKRKLLELSSSPSVAGQTAPTTSRKIPKEPEFVAIKVEAIDPSLPVEQTFNNETLSCNMLNAQDEDD
uniref:MADF domain-containing protein n=1 Tax=Anopheles maculatus TaxID=74869 RepID=A0A182SFF8_9DIPT